MSEQQSFFLEMPLLAIAKSSWIGKYLGFYASDAFPVEPQLPSTMLAIASAFLFYLCLAGVVGERRCPSPRAPPKGTVACFRGNDSVSCASASFAGSLVEFTCSPFYKLAAEERRTARCLSNGSWSLPAPKCIPDCGRRTPSVSLILGGATAPRGAFPWHAALYHFLDGTYDYWCGGSLVSPTAVITAAHCVWDVPPERLVLAFGKFHREYGVIERGVQKIRARRVETLESYQDVAGNYNGDIAVVVLERAVRVGPYSAPVCLDWGARREVGAGSTGVVVGWGLTEREALSDGLRAVRLSVVSDEECIASQEAEFKKFVTYTSFCAGLRKGGGVCNGDSGGGMVFFDEGSGRWYLEGVVSVSPRRRGTPYCDPRFYTVFTKVGMFSRWLSGFVAVRGWVAGGEEERGRGVQGVLFPHSVRMLQLAGLLPSATAAPRSP